MGGFDNDTSREFSKLNREHQSRFIGHRTKLHREWKKLGLDKQMTFLEYCKLNKKRKRK